jgi:hypothetical protein
MNENYKSGWIGLYRSISDNWIYPSNRAFTKFEAWIDIMLTVNHSDKDVLLGAELVKCNRGQKITSQAKLMKRWGWSKSKLLKFLDVLKSDSMINYKSDPKKTTITVLNYSGYQDFKKIEDIKKDYEKTIKDLTKRLEKDTNNNDNNSNKKEEPTKPDNKIVEKLKSFNPEILKICKWFIDQMEQNAKDKITNKIKLSWCDTVDKCNRIDGFKFSRIEEIVKYAKNDPFWSSNFMSLTKLRSKKSGEDLSYIFRWDAKLKTPDAPKKETYEQIVARTQGNQNYTF